MKDTVISAKAKRREIIIAAWCFLAAFLINVCAVIAFSTPWTEIFTQIGYVFIISAVLYVLVWVVRLCVMAFRALFVRKGRA